MDMGGSSYARDGYVMMGWWGKLWRTKAESWYFAPIPEERVPDGLKQAAVPPEERYVSAFLTAMHVADVRVATRTFYGAVVSSITLGTRGDGRAEFMVVTTPATLRNIDAKNLDRVVTLNKRLLGPVPYRGGDLDLELGLILFPSADLLEPYLGIIEKVAMIAGVSLVTAGVPLEPLVIVKSALNLLLGASHDPQLQIGVATTFAAPRTGYFCAIKASREDPSLHGLAVASDHRLVRHDGKEVEHPYLLFTLTASEQRDDWSQIPELRSAYAGICDAARAGDLAQAQHALAMFRRTAVLSPDLLAKDGQRLARLVADEVSRAFPDVPTAREGVREMPDLSSLSLYATATGS